VSAPVVHAYETQFEFSGKRDHAVIVEFGKPWRFVFWAQAQYAGTVQLSSEVMFTPQWCEENSPNDEECYEPMMDKQLRYSRIQILESGPARARIKWSYALTDIQYRVFHGNSRAEEIYTIYPDGVAVREIVIWPGDATNHGGNTNFWQVHEWYMINAKGSTPSMVLNRDAAFTMRNGVGGSFSFPWPIPTEKAGPLCDKFPQIKDWPNFIGKINMKDIPNPFAVICKSQKLFPFMPCSSCGGNHPFFTLFQGIDTQNETGIHNSYVHWPASDKENFIGWVSAGGEVGTVPTHSCFIDCNFSMRRKESDFVQTPAPGTTWYLLIGATGHGTDGSELDPLALSYRFPAEVTVHREASERGDPHRGRVLVEGYDYSGRTYTFRQNDRQNRVEVALQPKDGVPVINPVFLVNGWDAVAQGTRVVVDGAELHSEKFVAQNSGSDLVVWVEGVFSRPTSFGFHG